MTPPTPTLGSATLGPATATATAPGGPRAAVLRPVRRAPVPIVTALPPVEEGRLAQLRAQLGPTALAEVLESYRDWLGQVGVLLPGLRAAGDDSVPIARALLGAAVELASPRLAQAARRVVMDAAVAAGQEEWLTRELTKADPGAVDLEKAVWATRAGIDQALARLGAAAPRPGRAAS